MTALMTPTPFRIERMRRETRDTFTIDLAPSRGQGFSFRPGQFNMLYAFGMGEVPISISGDPAVPETLTHTIRAVGTVTEALRTLRVDDEIGVRGPFGTGWPLLEAEGLDVVIVTGGIGLAPLRPAIHHLLAHRKRYGRIVIFYGARTPEDILYPAELMRWRGRFDLSVHVTVDHASGSWNGRVGLVTKLLDRGGFDPLETLALVCGPEVMMRHVVAGLIDRGVAAERIHVSMERNMKCAVGFCGHCQFGSQFVCKDGPVFRYDRIQSIFRVREL